MSIDMNRREFIRQASGLVACTAIGSAQAQPAWPTKPVRVVVPVGAGGTADILARTISEAMRKATGQAFVVDLKPGAGGAIASLDVIKQPPDGHTLLVATISTHALVQATNQKIGHGYEDYTPIGLLADARVVMMVTPKLGAKSVKELIETARAKPGVLNYYSTGVGSFTHLMSAMLETNAKIKMVHVPYQGFTQALPDLVDGRTHLTWDAIGSALPYVKDGRLTAIGVTGKGRTSVLPELPTVTESMSQLGLPDISANSWFAVVAPKGMSPELARRINEELNSALRSPEVVARYTSLGMEPPQSTPAEFASMWRADTERWRSVVRDAGIKIG